MSKSITDIYARRGKRGEVERFDFSGAEAKKEIDQYIDTIKATKADLDADKAASAEYADRAERSASSSEQSASSAAGNAADAISAARSAKKSADDAAKVKSSVDISAGDATAAAEESRKIKEEIAASVKTAADSATAAGESADAAANSASAASESEQNTKRNEALLDEKVSAAANSASESAKSADAASGSKTEAEKSASAAAKSAESASTSEGNASASAKNAAASASAAAKSAESASVSEGNASTYAQNAVEYANTASESKKAAAESAKSAAESARAAAESADKLVIDDVLSGTSTNAIQNKAVSDSISEVVNNFNSGYFKKSKIRKSYVDSTTGEIKPDVNDTNPFCRTDYIDLRQFSFLTIYGEYNNPYISSHNAFYDGHKDFIKTFVCKDVENNIPIPDNARYFIISANESFFDSCMISGYSAQALETSISLRDNLKSLENRVYSLFGNKIVQDCAFWEKLILNADSEYSVYEHNLLCAVCDDAATDSGILTIKIKVLLSTMIYIVRSKNNTVLDIAKYYCKSGVNVINTDMSVNIGDNIGVIIQNGNAMMFGLVDRKTHFAYLNEIPTIGSKFDVLYSYTKSFYFDYFLSAHDKKEININPKLSNSSENVNIKLIGDSITYGYRLEDISKAWSHLLKSNLESAYSCIVNIEGNVGKDSGWFVEHISSLITDTDDVVICMIGTNNRYSESDYNRLYSDITTIYDYCNRKNILFIPVLPPPSTPDGTEGEEKGNRIYHMEQICNKLIGWCVQHNVEYIDLFEDFYEMIFMSGKKLSDYLIDGLHPNNDGHYLMYRLVSKALGVFPKIKEATW